MAARYASGWSWCITDAATDRSAGRGSADQSGGRTAVSRQFDPMRPDALPMPGPNVPDRGPWGMPQEPPVDTPMQVPPLGPDNVDPFCKGHGWADQRPPGARHWSTRPAAWVHSMVGQVGPPGAIAECRMDPQQGGGVPGADAAHPAAAQRLDRASLSGGAVGPSVRRGQTGDCRMASAAWARTTSPCTTRR